jgi:hypothetical protein
MAESVGHVSEKSAVLGMAKSAVPATVRSAVIPLWQAILVSGM